MTSKTADLELQNEQLKLALEAFRGLRTRPSPRNTAVAPTAFSFDPEFQETPGGTSIAAFKTPAWPQGGESSRSGLPDPDKLMESIEGVDTPRNKRTPLHRSESIISTASFMSGDSLRGVVSLFENPNANGEDTITADDGTQDMSHLKIQVAGNFTGTVPDEPRTAQGPVRSFTDVFVNGNDRQTETEGSRVISNWETSQVSASSSRAKSATPITDEAGLNKIKFLISGTPANGPTISMLDVAQKLQSHVKKAIDGWNKKQKKGNWSKVCDVLRCVETRMQKFNVTRVPLHPDPEHKTACARCVKSRIPCMLILRGRRPVVLPLPRRERPAGLCSRDMEYYVKVL
jgi:hypothetical protein